MGGDGARGRVGIGDQFSTEILGSLFFCVDLQLLGGSVFLSAFATQTLYTRLGLVKTGLGGFLGGSTLDWG